MLQKLVHLLKTPGASSLSDFRPISLCNTVFKVIAKLLAARLKLITPKAVQRNQVGFVKGRQLCENVLLASELVADFHKDGATNRGCLQVDITKAYDSIEWEFVLNILQAFDLPAVFISWIRECITTPHYSVSLNGELAGFFPGKKGLRQGDPISSSLFVMAMDILSKDLDTAAREGGFGIHPQCSNPLITHLSFADDLLIFFDGSSDSLRGILYVLRDFQRRSGLALNLRKTCVFVDGNNNHLASDLAMEFGLVQGALPVKYLGVPLLPHKMRSEDYQPLIDKVKARVNTWTAKRLSFAGRLQLFQSVIYSMINFWSSIFPLPKECLEALEQICNAFLWTGASGSARGAKVSWEVVCSPKQCGGLGLKRLLGLNEVYGVKLIWLFFAGTDSLWVAWIRNHVIAERLFWIADFSSVGSWIWRRLMKLRFLAKPRLLCHVNSGTTASFWHDNWTELGSLIDIIGPLGPLLSGIPIESSVAEAVTAGAWRSSRSRNPVLLHLRQSLPAQIPDVTSFDDDYYLWRNAVDDPPSSFSASKVWLSINPLPPLVSWYKAIWFPQKIPKHSFIAWLVLKNRMLTRDRMRSWGLVVPAECLLCGHAAETVEHLFFDCQFSVSVWNYLMSRCRMIYPSSLHQIITWLIDIPVRKKIRVILKLLFQALVYFLWKERNSRLHSGARKPVVQIAKEVQLQIRAKLLSLDRDAASNSRTTQPARHPSQSYLSTWFDRFQH